MAPAAATGRRLAPISFGNDETLDKGLIHVLVDLGHGGPLKGKVTYILNNMRLHYKYFTISFSCRSTIDLLQQFSGCSFQMNTTSILLRVQQKPSYPRPGARRPPAFKMLINSYTYLRTMSSDSQRYSRVHHWLFPYHWCHYGLPSKPILRTRGTIVNSRIDYYILGWKHFKPGIAAYVFNQFRRNHIPLIAMW